MESPSAEVSAAPIRRSILFVCTGNTCRSPLAESLCRFKLAQALGCSPGELDARGFTIASAGVMALPGDSANSQAIQVAEEFGAELARHRSRPVTPEMLNSATDVFAMTDMHLMLVLRYGAGPEPKLLCSGEDLPDPIGGDTEEYRACARVIASQLDRLIPGWLGS
jgi:protein-tyrosine-phosphatase